MVFLDVASIEVPEEVHRLDRIRLVRLVWHAEKLGEGVAHRVHLDLELVDQHILDLEVLASSRARRKLELIRRDHRHCDEVVELSAEQQLRLVPLLERYRQSFRNMRHTLLRELGKRCPRPRVDELDHTQELVSRSVDDRRNEHLPRAVAGALVHLLEKMNGGLVAL